MSEVIISICALLAFFFLVFIVGAVVEYFSNVKSKARDSSSFYEAVNQCEQYEERKRLQAIFENVTRDSVKK